ncbi:MAG: methyltransferase domain-containing protein [Spirochaetaceae bacterium]|nr:MAG: methyltransferase domain-containing protein [Spirochaetaceae bacterium]
MNRRERMGDRAEVERWNSRASSYAEHSESEESQARRDWILAWLEQAGAFRKSYRVLDIGAGPGNFAIPFARKAAEVVAVEPAQAMVSILEHKIQSQGLNNIRILPKIWEDVDLAAQGWKGAFDLVFASMSPGIGNPDMLEKMNAASRAFCYLSGWSGCKWGRWGLAQRELWPLIFGEDLGDYPGDILYPFGMLYALGYRPELRFFHPRIQLEMSEQEAMEGLLDHFSRYVEIGPEIRKTISSYVHRNSLTGTFRQAGNACQGFMLWSVARD